jgi:protoheme IX farnesyltransferase
MKAATAVCPEAPLLTQARVADYVSLTKPRILVMVLFTVAAGALLAAGGMPELGLLANALLGTTLVAAGASALNQLLERETDARMRRTENRPLPAGRLQPVEVLAFALLLGVGGVIYLAVSLAHPAAALVAAFTFVSYVFVYTPLKRMTTLNTLVGAVPGALPPVIGWEAVRGSVGAEAVALFAIVFLWQVPHFLAIAWMYREDYARADLRMLPVVDPAGTLSSRQMVCYCLALIPASLAPAALGVAGPLYLVGALILGAAFLKASLGFARTKSLPAARGVLRASLLYLPALLALLLVEVLAGGQWLVAGSPGP